MSTRSKKLRLVAFARECISKHGFETRDAFDAFFAENSHNPDTPRAWHIAASEAQALCDAHGSKMWAEHRTVQ